MPSLLAAPTTLVLPALHSALADVPTTVLTVSVLAAHAQWLTAEQHTDVFALRRRAPWSALNAPSVAPSASHAAASAPSLLPPPTPTGYRAVAALVRPWRAWLGATTVRRVRRQKRRELVAFVLWCRAQLLITPSEIREGSLLSYGLWCAEQVTAGRLTRTAARRRLAVARAALLWRAREVAAWQALEPAA